MPETESNDSTVGDLLATFVQAADPMLAADLRAAAAMTPQHPAAPEPETDANGLREAVLRELGVCEFDEMVTDASMCRCGLPAVNHDTFAEQIVMSDHPTVARLLERVRVVEGERDDLMALAVEDTRRRGETIARAESAEAAHEAEKAAHERLRAAVGALTDDAPENFTPRLGDAGVYASDLRSLLAGGGAR